MSTNTDPRWRRLGELFDHAAPLAAPERAAFIAGLNGADMALRAELNAMLAADSGSGVLDSTPRDLAASLRVVDDTKTDLAGKQCGVWRIVDILGRGGMGAVYRAERADGAYQQQAALKLINLGVDSPEVRQRFLRERQFLASLQHPNIATLLDGGVAPDGTPYLAMELVEGQRIDEYCDVHRLTIVQRLRLMLQVFAAVQHAHQRLIVHRDLKPPNILVRADTTAKLLDFGIATMVDASGAAKATRDRPLTPEYAAPEQLEGQPVTTATDIYALGLILRELLGGKQRPSDAVRNLRDWTDAKSQPSSLVAAALGPDAAAIAMARGTNPRGLVRTLRGDLDTIVQRALAPEPARRYNSAQALATDIELWLAGRPVLARPDSWFYRTRMFVRRNRFGVALSAAAALALVVATVFSLQQANAAREAARDSEARALSLRAVNDTFDHLLHTENYLADANGVPTAARLLRDNLSAIDYFLVDQPQMRASLLWRSGRALRLAGDGQTAVKVLRSAVDAFAKAGAATTLIGREASIELVHALIDSGDGDAAMIVLDNFEQSLKRDEVNIDLQHHAIAFLRAKMALGTGKFDEAEKQIATALALAPAPSGEHGARYGTTALLAGTIRQARGATAEAGDHFSEALEAMAGDPHADLAPPHQPLAPAIKTLARLGAADAARDYAMRWRDLRVRYFGVESPLVREVNMLLEGLAQNVEVASDLARATRLHQAFASYWAATFTNYDVTREKTPIHADGKP